MNLKRIMQYIGLYKESLKRFTGNLDKLQNVVNKVFVSLTHLLILNMFGL